MADNPGVPLSPHAVAEGLLDPDVRKGGPIAPERHHRIAGIGDGENPRDRGNGLAGQAVGIALAVEPLVMTSDARAEIRQPGDVGDDPLAGDRVLLDVEVFRRRQGPFLAEDIVPDADLADVVEEPGEVEVADLASRQGHLFPEPYRDPRDPRSLWPQV